MSVKLTNDDLGKITLLKDFILLKEIKEKTKSKIIRIENNKEDNPVNSWAEVIKVGEEVESIKKGDMVWIAGVRLARIPVEDYTLFLAKDKEIMIIKKKKV